MQKMAKTKSTYLENAVLSTLLLLEDLKGLGLVAGRDDSVRDLSVDDSGSGGIDSVGESDEVAERGHSVGTWRVWTTQLDMRREETNKKRVR